MSALTGTMGKMTGSMEQSLADVSNLNTELSALKGLLAETQESLKTANGKMTEMTLAKIAELEGSLQALTASNKSSVSSASKMRAELNQMAKKLRAFNSEFRREMALIKKLQAAKIDDAANQIKFSR